MRAVVAGLMAAALAGCGFFRLELQEHPVAPGRPEPKAGEREAEPAPAPEQKPEAQQQPQEAPPDMGAGEDPRLPGDFWSGSLEPGFDPYRAASPRPSVGFEELPEPPEEEKKEEK